ncbi:MAG: Glutamyl-tRNAGlu reductase, dimerization domain, partial [Thermodesulfobacteriota bacterium]|nr:Glutamyl-tRNAGlu reductase, dimerization domain [Thermodesulfobacteriota bacterium]
GRLAELNDTEREAIDILTKSIINKIAHGPISFMKQSLKTSRHNQHIDFVQRVFDLNTFVSGSESEEAQILDHETDHRN